MKIFLNVIVWVAASTVVLGTLIALLHRLNNDLVSRGIIPGAFDRYRRENAIAEVAQEVNDWPRLHPGERNMSLAQIVTCANLMVRDSMSLAEAMASVRGIPIRSGLDDRMTMRDHMQITDVHLLRAQDYVVALGADGRSPELATLFKQICLAREALLAVADGEDADR